MFPSLDPLISFFEASSLRAICYWRIPRDPPSKKALRPGLFASSLPSGPSVKPSNPRGFGPWRLCWLILALLVAILPPTWRNITQKSPKGAHLGANTAILNEFSSVFWPYWTSKPSKNCKVTLVFENASLSNGRRRIPIDSDEVRVTREVKVSKSDNLQTKYFLNEEESSQKTFHRLLGQANARPDG